MRIEADYSRQIPFLEELNAYLLDGEKIEVERIRAETIRSVDLYGNPLHPVVELKFQVTDDRYVPVRSGGVNLRRMYWIVGGRDENEKSAEIHFLRDVDIPTLQLAVVNGERAINFSSNNIKVENEEDIVRQREGREKLFSVVKRVLRNSSPIQFILNQ